MIIFTLFILFYFVCGKNHKPQALGLYNTCFTTKLLCHSKPKYIYFSNSYRLKYSFSLSLCCCYCCYNWKLHTGQWPSHSSAMLLPRTTHFNSSPHKPSGCSAHQESHTAAKCETSGGGTRGHALYCSFRDTKQHVGWSKDQSCSFRPVRQVLSLSCYSCQVQGTNHMQRWGFNPGQPLSKHFIHYTISFWAPFLFPNHTNRSCSKQ